MGLNLQKRDFIISLFIIALFSIPQTAFAQTTTDEPTTTAGITPDSWLYGLDVAIDQISLSLTFDNGAKARKGLEIARERLLEVREMVEENKLEAAERAQSEHANVLGTVQSAVGDIERANSTQEIEEEIEIEKELEEHEKKIITIKNELKVKIKIKGEATEEQQALIDSILNSLENKTGKVKIEIDNKKGKTKIKIKQQTGMSDEEVEDEIDEIEEKKGLTRIRLEWAQKAIEHAEEKITTAQEKINEKRAEGVNVTIAEDYLNQANTLLAQAKDALNATEYRDARKLAQEAGKLAMHAKRGKSFGVVEERELEIEVEIEEGKADVEIEINGVDTEFILDTTNRDDIIAEIVSRTGLTIEEVEQVIEFKEKVEKVEEEAECVTDADCKEGKICIDGKCKVKEEKEVECVVDADCKEEEVCVEGECEKGEEGT